MSSIEWTDQTWNPTVGCSRVSPGCEHCYAEGVAHRAMQDAHRGLTVLGESGPRWTGEVRLLPDRLETPMKWKSPRRVFVDSMSDLFHEQVPFEYIAKVYAIMQLSQQHTFQVLTKRPERALSFYEWMDTPDGRKAWLQAVISAPDGEHESWSRKWPFRNVWLGVSIEDQRRSEERLLPLMQCPAAVRFVSVEPMLEPVVLGLAGTLPGNVTGGAYVMAHQMIDWVICGGESGARARSFDIAWARALRDECAAVGVAFFLKQLGAHPIDSEGRVVAREIPIGDRKGGKMAEWPEDLRVRQWPEVSP